MRFWIGVAARDHVRQCRAGGFAQLGHGKQGPARRLAAGDWLCIYSPQDGYRAGAIVQAFTALGEVIDDRPYRDTLGAYRRRLRYLDSREAAIKPLIEQLGFIRDKSRWGFVFRYGLVEIPRGDFLQIAHAMVEGEAFNALALRTAEPARAATGDRLV